MLLLMKLLARPSLSSRPSHLSHITTEHSDLYHIILPHLTLYLPLCVQLSVLCSIQFDYLSSTVYYLCRPVLSLLSPCVLKSSHISIYLIRSSSYVLSSYTFHSAISLTPLPPPPPFISSSQHLSLFFFSSSSFSSRISYPSSLESTIYCLTLLRLLSSSFPHFP